MSQPSTTGVEVIHTNARWQDMFGWLLNWIPAIVLVVLSSPVLPIIILVMDYEEKRYRTGAAPRSIYSTRLRFYDRYMWLGRWVTAVIMVALMIGVALMIPLMALVLLGVSSSLTGAVTGASPGMSLVVGTISVALLVVAVFAIVRRIRRESAWRNLD